MLLKESAMAGSAESSDVMVILEPQSQGIEIELNSPVEQQFGDEIRQVITDALQEMKVESARVKVVDKGALNGVIRARVQSAVRRSVGDEQGWQNLS